MTVKKPGGAREGSLKVRVKTSRKRTISSTLWLQRQLNDPYVMRAKKEGLRSRAAYKLIEMDERYHLLKTGQKIIDLGAAPGGWSQYAIKKVGTYGRVIGIDLLDIDPIPGVEFTIMDFLDEDAPIRLRGMLGGEADGVMSDMAANTTGHKKTDHLKIVGLAELAIHFACEILAPGGFFVAKVFQGGTEGDLLAMLKRDFDFWTSVVDTAGIKVQ